MCIRRRMYLIILLIITDIIRPGLDLQQLWQLGYIVPIIGAIMVVIMVVIIMVVIIMLSLIPGTGIKLVSTIVTETDPLPCPITGQRVIMEPDRQIARQQEHLIVPLPGHPIDPQQVHLIELPQEHQTVHPLAHQIGLPHQMFLQEHQVVPAVAEVIVEVVVVE